MVQHVQENLARLLSLDDPDLRDLALKATDVMSIDFMTWLQSR